MKSKLDNKFKHNVWYKGAKLTCREAITKIACIQYDMCLSKKPSKVQNDELFSDINYDYVLTDGRCFYRLSDEEYDLYMSIKRTQ